MKLKNSGRISPYKIEDPDGWKKPFEEINRQVKDELAKLYRDLRYRRRGRFW